MRLGDYEIVGEIARGAHGVVYRARRAPHEPEVALKLLRHGAQAGEVTRKRFRREAEALTRLQHPNVVDVIAVEEHAGQPLLVLEYVAGESLQDRLARGPLEPGEAARITACLAGALDHAHRLGLLHRDVKPANVLLDPQGEPKLTDFGLVKDLDPQQSRLSLTGQFMGTPGYLAPEQAHGELDRLGPPADVYALGGTLYAMLTGVPPFQGETIQELLQAADRPPLPPSQLRPGLDPALERVCLRCLARQPQARPSAAELVDLLERTRRADQAPAPASRRAAAAVVALGGVLAAAVLLTRGGPSGGVAGANAGPTASGSPTPRATPAASPEPTTSDPSPAAWESARALHRAGDERAEQAYAAAIAAAPADPRGHFWLAVFLSERGRTSEALVPAREATRLAPDDALAHRELGKLLAVMLPGQGAEGMRHLDRALELDPLDAEAWGLRGLARSGQGRKPEALSDLDRSLELAASNPLARFWRAQVRLDLGDRAGAADDLEQVLAREGLPPAFRAGCERLLAQVRPD